MTYSMFFAVGSQEYYSLLFCKTSNRIGKPEEHSQVEKDNKRFIEQYIILETSEGHFTVSGKESYLRYQWKKPKPPRRLP